jgi:hypothetical protein
MVARGDAVVVQFDLGQELIQADAVRLMEAVITGVSFLGAGTIIRRRGGGYADALLQDEKVPDARLLETLGVEEETNSQGG